MATSDSKTGHGDQSADEEKLLTLPTEEESSTYRTLTEKGRSFFEENYSRRVEFIDREWNDIATMSDMISTIDDEKSLQSLKSSLEDKFKKHLSRCEELVEFCRRSKTVEGHQAAIAQSTTKSGRKIFMDTTLRQISSKLQDLIREKGSVRSRKSKLTHSKVGSKASSAIDSQQSDISSVIVRKKAKAEAAKVRVQFAEKEAEMKRRQAFLEEQFALEEAKLKREKADLSVEQELNVQKCEAAAAEAEAQALEQSEQGDRMSALFDTANQEIVDPVHRTQEFVERDNFSRLRNNNEPSSHDQRTYRNNNAPLNSNADSFFPAQTASGEFTRYLLKKDLLLSRLSAFDDRPESYLTWKVSFTNVMEELSVSPIEELDLLLKWCGTESKKHVLSIKSANASDPIKGLERAWNRLEERYGCPEMLEASLKRRVETFPKLSVKDVKKLYELSDLASEIEAIKCDSRMTSLLGHYDSSTGVTPIVNKLPHYLQQKWTSSAIKYMSDHNVAYPPFMHFAQFLRDQSRIRNNPSFAYETPVARRDNYGSKRDERIPVKVNKTNSQEFQKVDKSSKPSDDGTTTRKCPLHNTEHPLIKCRLFRSKPIQIRMQILKENKICFKCCKSTAHMKKDCKETVCCEECKSDSHPTALHVNLQSSTPSTNQSGESSQNVSNACTRICGKFPGKSCAKIVLANIYPSDRPDCVICAYIMIDDQSNRSLANSQLFDSLRIESEKFEYTLTSCSGTAQTIGRRANGIVVESLDRTVQIHMPVITECSHLLNNHDEIPTPEVAQNYAHLHDLVPHIPPIDDNAQIMMLIGRDVIMAHHVTDQRIGPGNTPYAQKLPLGWVIIGDCCLGKSHLPELVSVCKTNLLASGRGTMLDPCTSQFRVQEKVGVLQSNEITSSGIIESDSFGADVFTKTSDDEIPGLSIEDKAFLEIMDTSFKRDKDGYWICPLPLKANRPSLPNNYNTALKRANILDKSLQKNPVKREQFLAFMDRTFKKGHAEKAPPLKNGEESWFLPIFGVYHPRKKDQVRVVFDSAAKHNDISLNDVLYSGPDLTNSLLGILMRFRRGSVAILADIELMFYCFKVRCEDRNYLRFLWHDENDFDKPLVQYRMCVHIFGSTASPAVATYGIRKTASLSTLGKDVTEFVSRDFYVDDALTSLPTVEQAVDLLRRTQSVLKTEGNLRLHKIASNREEVMQAFPPEELAKDLKDVDFGAETLPIQRSLGVAWSLEKDAFLFHIAIGTHPYTRRGVLSCINSIFDPLGFLAPVIIEGKLQMRSLISCTSDWDAPLPGQYLEAWERWTISLKDLHDFRIPRTYLSTSWVDTPCKSVHIFSDASEKAIAAVGYILSVDHSGHKELGFILGKTKIAPLHGHTIPRLELCAAVLAEEIAGSIVKHLDMPIEEFTFYTDSRVVLGYIHNQTRRFYTYVTNRIAKIRSSTHPRQWQYVSTTQNPADQATRAISASELSESTWITGPAFLLTNDVPCGDNYEMQDPDKDKEVRPEEVHSLKTSVSSSLGTHRFNRFSRWKQLVETIAHLTHIAQCFKGNSDCHGWHTCTHWKTVDSFDAAQQFVLREVQSEAYAEEILCLNSGKPVPKTSHILKLSPYIDNEGLIRVGGRLERANLTDQQKHPIIVPGRHHVATLLIRYYHERIRHQGRHITEGALRSGGIWITGAKSLVSSVIHKCVKCCKLRAERETQKMADLPSDRLEPTPPFTNVGIDCFGPWEVVFRKTRGGQTNSKRWAVMFTCLTIRAVHIEVVESLSSSSFINALRRFMAIRGPVKLIRSDRGTNFVGSTDDLGINAVNVEDDTVQQFLYDHGATWIFNPPHASHMGGVWERVIGLTRRILDSLMTSVPGSGLTHECLVTFLAEASAIINARPLVPLTTDPDDPAPLSPSLLLTQKPPQASSSCEIVDTKDLYRKEWKRVQTLADMFWHRWRTQYLQTLQLRRKWQEPKRNMKPGDVVLVRDKQAARNDWPMGVVIKTFESSDKLVRKCEVRIVRNGKTAFFTRPVTELVLLLSSDS